MSLINQHILALATTLVTTLGLAIFVAFQPIRKSVKWTFVLYSLSITLWGAGQAYALYEPNMVLSLMSVRLCHIGVILIPVFFIHFLMNLLEKTKDARKIVYLIYGVGLFFLIFVPTQGIVKDVTLHPPNFRYVYNPGYLYPLLIVFWFLSVCYGLYLLFTEFIKSSELKRNQLKYLFIGTLLGYLGGVSNFLFAYDIHIKIYMPYGTYAIPFYIAIFTYAITRYQLMDIEVIIKKTLVYAGLFTFAFGVIVGVALITQELISQFLLINRFVSLAISAVIIIFSLRPLENFLINATNLVERAL